MNHRTTSKTLLTCALLAVALLPAITLAANPGGGGAGGGGLTVFESLYDFIKGLLTGSLGKFLTILALAVALVIAVKVQSIIGILGAFAIALAAVYGPAVLEGLFTATLPPEVLASAALDAMHSTVEGARQVLPAGFPGASCLPAP